MARTAVWSGRDYCLEGNNKHGLEGVKGAKVCNSDTNQDIFIKISYEVRYQDAVIYKVRHGKIELLTWFDSGTIEDLW